MFFLYHRTTSLTGRVLGRALGGRWGTERYRRGTENVLIRWGSVDGSDVPVTINPRDAIVLASDKLRSLRVMQEAGVSVIPFSTDRFYFIDEDFPLFGRNRHHTRGGDIRIIENFTVSGEPRCDFYTRYIRPRHEYRIHVAGGEVIRSQIKSPSEGANPDAMIRNRTHGWILNGMNSQRPNQSRLDAAVAAVEALGLDFGAVDLVVGADDNREYVLEVNTAPRCDERTARAYVDALHGVLRDRGTTGLTPRYQALERLAYRAD